MAHEEPVTLWNWGWALAVSGERVASADKFDAAIESFRALGAGPRMIERVMADKASALGPAPSHIDLGQAKRAQEAESKLTGTFRKEGEFWTISYDTTTFRLKDAKGLRYIAYLLARPGNRIHVYDLIEAVEGSAATQRTTIHAESEDLEIVREIGSAGPTIDGRARSEYRTRLRDLQADLDEADRMNDLGRRDRLRTEMEMVGEELTGSSALGGRARAASGSAERARGPVRKSIRSVVEKIRLEHPALGRHFAGAISTGYFCAYQPDSDHPIFWQL
jgi:non-specific serine/threonine protein kinase